MFAWIFGSGFPKATRIDAEGYDGFRYGKQSAKPAMEPIYMGQKPFSEKNGTLNILKWGTGAVNIDGCRVHADDAQGGEYTITRWKPGATLNQTGGTWKPEEGGVDYHGELQPGRWPANVIHDGSEEVLAAFPDSAGQQGDLNGHSKDRLSQGIYGDMKAARDAPARGDSGSAARFFYSAKADAEDRLGSKHPTIKPLDLIQYLVRFVTPPRGTVLDCFAGTGTTGEAAWRENMRAILIEKDADSIADIKRRIDLMQKPAKRAAVAKTKNNLQGAEGTPLFDKVSHPLPTRAESSAGDAAPPEPFPARTNSEAA
jgi:site-specific DNA-methyltransferase (adenine-specific)